MKRRDVIKSLGLAGAATVLRLDADAQGQPLTAAGKPVELRLASLSPSTIRIAVVPRDDAPRDDVELNRDGALTAFTERRAPGTAGTHTIGSLRVTVAAAPLTIRIADASGRAVQEIGVGDTGTIEVLTGNAPLPGFGEGGQQFDRRGVLDQMRNGQGGYQLRTHGGRVPIQWLIGTEGWALFLHQPFGTFDLTGAKGKLTSQAPLPLDCFLVVSKDPAVIMREFARITGLPEMPPLWSFGYQQSHRTLAGPD